MAEQKSDPASVSSDREIVISRVLDAPRELVFDVWTDPKHVGAWYGPRGFTLDRLQELLARMDQRAS